MTAICGLKARSILDSRGCPTVEVDCLLASGAMGRAAVPSGASTGEAEALELRDGGPRWLGKGVDQAVANIHEEIAPALSGLEATSQERIDAELNALDGTAEKKRLGANSILAVSMAVCRAAADECGLPLYRYLGGPSAHRLPVPLLNVINGGAHANNSIDFQEFMIAPIGAPDFATGLRWGAEIYQHLKKLLSARGLTVAVGDEGGFAPDLPDESAVLDVIEEATQKAGYKTGRTADIAFALDVAASEFFRDGAYRLGAAQTARSSEAMTELYRKLTQRYPIISIEDGLDQADWAGWKSLTAAVGKDVRLVGDDLFVTQEKLLARGIREGAANAILIKLNQVGTVSETLRTIDLATRAGFRVIISHRSGETEDTFIADLAVGTGAGWIKTGAPCRTDRNAKYNQLLRLAEELGPSATYGPVRV
ncbi:MAG: phosphopyruvate hydratase [Planctomycetota bacterium]